MNEKENCRMEMFYSFLSGAITGLIIGFLYAPQSGKRTKQNISNFIEDIEGKGNDLIDKGKNLIEKGEEFIEKQKKILKC